MTFYFKNANAQVLQDQLIKRGANVKSTIHPCVLAYCIFSGTHKAITLGKPIESNGGVIADGIFF